MVPTLDFWEYIYGFFALIIGLSFIFTVKPEMRTFFLAGLGARMFGGIAFGLIYLFYYQGGDTVSYYDTALAVVNVLLDDPITGIELWTSEYTRERLFTFTADTGYPHIHIYSDPNSYAVSQILVPFLLIAFKSYLIATILMATVFFYGPWMLFKMVRELIVDDYWISFLACLLIPSVIFWGSGISKDNITFSASCYFTFGFYSIFIKRESSVLRIVLTIISVLLLLFIKPYIFLVLFPGTLFWMLYSRVQSIKSIWIRNSVLPLLTIASIVLMSFVFSQLAGVLGDYSFDNILDKAIVTQEDLKKDYYGGNNFDIGTIDPSLVGVMSKFPIATFYGLFGPTLVEVNSPVMLFAAVENTILLGLCLYLLLWKPRQNLRRILNSPFLVFCLLYVLFFGFSIGLTTPNYGALVRFKIPLMPFFIIFLGVLTRKKAIRAN